MIVDRFSLIPTKEKRPSMRCRIRFGGAGRRTGVNRSFLGLSFEGTNQ